MLDRRLGFPNSWLSKSPIGFLRPGTRPDRRVGKEKEKEEKKGVDETSSAAKFTLLQHHRFPKPAIDKSMDIML